MADGEAGVFHMLVTGAVECGHFPTYNNLYCKYTIVFGDHWTATAGIEEGVSQIASRSSHHPGEFVWNFPIDITLKSQLPRGWPQIVVAVYGLDMFGRDIVRGYGTCHLPVTAGHHTLKIPTFAPRPTTRLQHILGWFLGQRPEFYESTFVAAGEGREVVRVRSHGHVIVKCNVAFKDFHRLGFHNAPSNQN
ncbi:B9 domain-containing protein 1 [Salpingoeca rosetta]|uniref:B9 domain-containing protein 1 n=1 Tax=Salpingoeca rosetta (strain ATCC 50818 / BSB-021) TaxID=946362 RepID=F2TWK7_SALR5|nr:B9 domain-containing protein 1 [Salpingoeca rosetta]EGD72453.1 B9 domain-containing protein 1 [Salpingoeca rosetta]|eukprot:XP_004999022.1 B9 domain-containing protein 1 [Salpingoeca rosetta]